MNIQDLLEVINSFLSVGEEDADVNGDLIVDVLELLEIISNFNS